MKGEGRWSARREPARGGEAGGGRDRGDERAPGHVDHGDRRRPGLQRRLVGQVIGGIGDETEDGGVDQQALPTALAQRRQDRQNDDAGHVQQIEDHRWWHRRLFSQQLADARLVEPVDHLGQPDDVEDQHRQGGPDIGDGELDHWAVSAWTGRIR
ncbi:hypothetical protein CC_2602 [Caulobacter vibrioides CB15]|uniref:Uncharacterized protein n=1 Tax=Caulobacter vibrioides (strain ATCC 19089 / CIP 103742 / CB 15) TaxID=190650 RepID=Q9A562_CAUVC|nr:hypothetical protein CC_2602 [Caulobacter vibrioides CB15]